MQYEIVDLESSVPLNSISSIYTDPITGLKFYRDGTVIRTFEDRPDEKRKLLESSVNEIESYLEHRGVRHIKPGEHWYGNKFEWFHIKLGVPKIEEPLCRTYPLECGQPSGVIGRIMEYLYRMSSMARPTPEFVKENEARFK